jgi:hypothetical protein
MEQYFRSSLLEISCLSEHIFFWNEDIVKTDLAILHNSQSKLVLDDFTAHSLGF